MLIHRKFILVSKFEVRNESVQIRESRSNSCADPWLGRVKRLFNFDSGGNERDGSEIALENPTQVPRQKFW